MQEQKQGYEASNDMFSSSLISFFLMDLIRCVKASKKDSFPYF